ncbi:phage head-tail connector protein [Ligilactobacillus sp. WILCCON 0076]|uniref:Phage head-tail connector protein n=1 Tax=Ligilactobacillus ubinensis TaxID=2876789 RepID=A0A9X2JK75_9LACO|nr:phage head-tail connector protein [Ligilactobacillus ubinensis]MCP0885914.1 phage head-tail connector protein [Ligilactobacillus ubinensis]
MADILSSVKLRIGISDTIQDDLLNDLIADTQDRVMSYINQDGDTGLVALPNSTDWIVKDVVIKMYNRIGDEGKSSSGESDISNSWESIDLSEYSNSLDQYRKSGLRKRAGMRWV